MAKKDEIISQTEFARRVGVSEAAVRNAIKKGRIEKGRTTDENGRPAIKYETAFIEWHENAQGKTKTKPNQPFTPPSLPGNRSDDDDDEDDAPQPAQESTASLNRKLKRIQIASAAHDLQVKKGIYVEKQKVYHALFAVGQEVRQAIEAIPDRTIDEILAVKSRNEAHTLLTKAINEALQRLSNIDNALDTESNDEVS